MESSRWTIKELLEKYESNEVTPKEVFAEYIAAIQQNESEINAFITLRSLEEIESELEHVNNPIPIAHKDVYSTKDIQTTAASNILKDYIPPYDATAVKKLKEANFITIGKVNCDAFAHGATGENSDFGPTRNPYAINRTPGGSSSGTAAAVAAGFTPVASGTDTGGSIRLPACFTNTVGLKPTYGRVSRYGIIAMTSSTDSIGHITQTVWDNAYVLNSTAGKDRYDATSSEHPVPDYLEHIDSGIDGTVIGYPKEYLDGLDTQLTMLFEEQLKTLEKLGATLQEISLPHTKYAISSYYIITPSEVSSNLGRFDGIRFGRGREAFGDEAKRRILMGTFSLSSGFYDAYYKKAQQVRTLIIEDFKKAYQEVDAIAAPVTAMLPPKIGEVIDDPVQTYMMDVLTVPANMSGIPSLSVPGGFVNDLPVGIQFMGDYFSEDLLYQIGQAFEKETQFYKTLPNFETKEELS